MTDRDKLTALLDELFKEGLTMTLGYMADYLMKSGVTVQKHGRWIRVDTDGEAISKCSVCKFPVSTFWNESDYCPNCGAKMDGDNNADNR